MLSRVGAPLAALVRCVRISLDKVKTSLPLRDEGATAITPGAGNLTSGKRKQRGKDGEQRPGHRIDRGGRAGLPAAAGARPGPGRAAHPCGRPGGRGAARDVAGHPRPAVPAAAPADGQDAGAHPGAQRGSLDRQEPARAADPDPGPGPHRRGRRQLHRPDRGDRPPVPGRHGHAHRRQHRAEGRRAEPGLAPLAGRIRLHRGHRRGHRAGPGLPAAPRRGDWRPPREPAA